VKTGDILVETGKITAGQLEQALRYQQESAPGAQLGDVLVELGFCRASDVLAAIGRQYHLPALERIDDASIDPALVERIPVDWARQHLVFPLRLEGEYYGLMADVEALPRLQELSLLLGEEVMGMLAPAAEIKRAIDRAYFERKQEVKSTETERAPASPESPRADDLLRAYDAAPVTQLVNSIILDAVRRKASDIHIEPYENHVRIRFRLDGFLYEQTAPPKHLEHAIISRLKVMSNLDIAEKRLPQDGVARVRAGEREIDIRVSTIPVAEGERVVLRLLNQSTSLIPLDELGMAPEMMTRFRKNVQVPNGIILVTGPTGSGKTTTLYAALREMDTHHRNVLTIEDPVEYQLPDIGQMQVKPRIGLTFAAGLRHILRQDPDVILVGEIRDQETAEIAVRAALTGHLVFSTLHTNDAASAAVRLVDMGVPPFLIASSVRAIMAQRLVRRLCPACRVPVQFSREDLQGLPSGLVEALLGKSGFAAAGCDACRQGYSGRVGIYELLEMGPEEQRLVRSGVDASAFADAGGAMENPMWRDAAHKVLAGVTTLDEIKRVLEPGAGS
jgi:general secretion pathway protein E